MKAICAPFDWVIIALKIESADPATSERDGPLSPSLCRCIDIARRSLTGYDREMYDIEAEGSFKVIALDHSSVNAAPWMRHPGAYTFSNSGISTWKMVFITAMTIVVT
jgi:hypothetical protein